ncbi:glycosyltransferase family 2 protein [Rhizorhapis sp. SPR117]|uniref:glycosyltransferase family 2 protein n=1 Tax=Rhizorhapis sp. SPR117 TaxID=2912611 RepID=UPI001F2E5BBA|nr:glycosyltransferase family 2 protein [Rhizorhapis sp. SPR117]
MATPRFSVIMPLHNKASHVAAAVESVLAQSLSPHELIVIDDCSTDGSRDIVASMNDPRIRLLDRNVPGPGGYAARNLGIKQASGDWIAFLDADDLWYENHLAVLATAISQAPNADAAATRFDHVFDTHRQPQRIARSLHLDGVLNFRQFLEAWLEVRECPLWTGAAAFRRNLLIAAGLFPDGRAVRGGDKDLWLRAMRSTRLVYAPITTAIFSRDSQNKVSKSTHTLQPPCLVETARHMIADATPVERRLLRRLINQEIAYYARYSMKSDEQIRIPLSDIAMPEGVGTIAIVAMARWVPASVRKSGYRLTRHMRMRRLAIR